MGEGLRAASHTRLRPMAIAFGDFSLLKKAETIQVHFTPEGEGIRVQLFFTTDGNSTRNSYMTDYT